MESSSFELLVEICEKLAAHYVERFGVSQEEAETWAARDMVEIYHTLTGR